MCIRDRNKEYLGVMGYSASYNSSEGNTRCSIVGLPDVRLEGTNNGDWEVGDIAYARVAIPYSTSNTAFFGRLDDVYLTNQSENNSNYTDILGSMMEMCIRDRYGFLPAPEYFEGRTHCKYGSVLFFLRTQTLRVLCAG